MSPRHKRGHPAASIKTCPRCGHMGSHLYHGCPPYAHIELCAHCWDSPNFWIAAYRPTQKPFVRHDP
jgi:hypothetical protein